MRTALLLSFLALAACGGEPMHGIELPDAEQAPPMHLMQADGAHFDLGAQKGKVVLLFFGYTSCPDVCPTTLADWARVRGLLGDDAERVTFVFVSVDPQRDTPEVALRYARQFDSTFFGLSGSERLIESMKATWKIGAYAEGDTRVPGYTVAHPAYTFVVDRAGRLRYLYEPGVGSEALAQDLRQLL